MKLNKAFLFLCGFLLATHFSFCQTSEIETQPLFKTELPEKNTLLPKESPETELPSYLKKEFFKGVADPNETNEHFDRPEINMGNQESFIDPSAYYLNKLSTPEKNKNPNNFKVDQYLGDFKSNAPYVQIVFRDHEAPDGDRVKIIFNDKTIIPNVLLEERFKQLKVDLVSGFNTLNFIALNQGEAGPNTAEVRVYDDKGNLITANQWNLATGTKATLIVVKE